MARVGTSRLHGMICPCFPCSKESGWVRNRELSMGWQSAFVVVVNDTSVRRSEQTTALYATVSKVYVDATTRAPSTSSTNAPAMHVPAFLNASTSHETTRQTTQPQAHQTTRFSQGFSVERHLSLSDKPKRARMRESPLQIHTQGQSCCVSEHFLRTRDEVQTKGLPVSRHDHYDHGTARTPFAPWPKRSYKMELRVESFKLVLLDG